MRLRRRKSKEPPHRHSFDVVGIQRVVIHDGVSEHPVDYRTDVLNVCAWCGARKVETLRGHWTLEQVRGLNPTAQEVS